MNGLVSAIEGACLAESSSAYAQRAHEGNGSSFSSRTASDHIKPVSFIPWFGCDHLKINCGSRPKVIDQRHRGMDLTDPRHVYFVCDTGPMCRWRAWLRQDEPKAASIERIRS